MLDWLYGLGVIAAVIIGAFYFGKRHERKRVREDNAKARAKAKEVKHDVESNVRNLDGDAINERLRPWIRE